MFLIVHVITGRSSAASSTILTPFVFTVNHPLIKTVHCSWSDFDHNTSDFPLYNLKMLFDHLSFTEENLESLAKNVKAHTCKCKKAKKHAIAWMYSLIPDKKDLSFGVDTALDAFQAGLMPFLTSTVNRPDGAILKRFMFGQEWELPILLVEVHSSLYKNSVAKTAMATSYVYFDVLITIYRNVLDSLFTSILQQLTST